MIYRSGSVIAAVIRLCFSMLKTILTFVLLLLCPGSTLAQGWADFEFSIDRNFRFVRCNSLQTIITNNGRIIFDPTDYPSVGPINKYSNHSSHIFIKNLGRRPRNAIPGDTFEEIDESVTCFFIIDKKSVTVSGPLTQLQFDSDPAVKTIGDVRWRHPYNPLGFFCLFSCVTIVTSPFLLIAFTRYRRRKQISKIQT